MEIEIEWKTLKDRFSTLRDPRVVGRTLHGLVDILFLSLSAMICGMEDWEAIEDWGNERLEWLRQHVALENGIPSHDTIARVFAALNSKQFQACFVRWMSDLCPSLEGEIVAMDGKTVRGARDQLSGKSAIHMVSAFVCGHGITLGQWKTDEKSNEITAIPELIDVLNLKGATVTLDAMGCQKKIAEAIKNKGAEYVFGLKGNHDTLHQQVQAAFNVTQWQNYQDFANWGHVTEETGHGRAERRRCVALAWAPTEQSEAWLGMQSVAMVESMRQMSDVVALERRYFISSLQADSERLAQAIRSHWEIENRLHWCLDVTFHEDACRIRADHAPENLNILRKIAMNLLRLNPLKRSMPKKRLKACLNGEYLAEVLGIS